MAEHVETQSGGLTEGVREGASELREDVSRENIESRLDDVVSENKLLQHLLDIRNVLIALAIAAVLTLLISFASSPKVGAFVLVLTFVAAWFILAARDYNKRRPTKPVDTDDDE
jgi:hypothetical protein